MKNKIVYLVAIATVMAVMPLSILYGQDTKGELSSDVAWRIENNTLYISGKGFVPTVMFRQKPAWDKSRSLFNAVVIEDGITLVGKNIFAGYNITSLSVAGSVKELSNGKNIFAGYNITSLSVAGSVKELSNESFSKCSKLTTVELKGATPPDLNHTTFTGVNVKKVKLIVPAGTKSTYLDDPLWSQFGTIEESTLTAQAAPAEKLTQPCTIQLRRKGGAIAVKFPVFLNGQEQEKLASGNTITLQTDQAHNMLYIKQGNAPLAVRRFEAKAGGEVIITVVYIMKTNVYMTMGEGDGE